MNDNLFNPHSHRARAARYRQIYDKIAILIGLVMVASFCFSFYEVVILKDAAGWFYAIPAPICLMMILWAEIGLKHIPLGKGNSINDILSGDAMIVLLRNKDINTKAISFDLTYRTKSGRFLSSRFGLQRPVLETLFANTMGADLGAIFNIARKVMAETDSRQIGGACLLVAMIESMPGHENFLAANHTSLEDLYAGIKWFNYIYNLAKIEKKPVRTGGIARDLNFGYIPTLQHYGQNISMRLGHSARSQVRYTSRGEALDKIIQIFSGNGKQNVALVGPEGSGRSIFVKALAEELLDETSKIPTSLKYRQIFQLDASALLSSAGGDRGSLERLLTKIFNEAYAAKNIIIYLNDAQLFFKEGTGSVDLTNIIMPIIEAGNLRIILSIEEQEFLELSSRNAGVANAFNRVNILPTNEEDTMKVLEDQVPYFESRFKVAYLYRAMKEAYRLGDRYVTDRAMPGRALRLLEIGADYAENGVVTANSISEAVEKTLGVKVKVAESSTDRDRLLNMENLIHERMVDQENAVSTVSSALRRAAAGVRNENRPIGTFLFLGPTGVGKTELAKAVSEVYFNGESEIVRLDLNEFVTATDVTRLIADGTEDEMSLTARVMKKPFSVVLLDEIEKAHPQVLTTLLQVLDEGVLRDVKNREVSFRDTIIIATSNAGADLIREYISEGMDLAEAKGKLTDHLIETGEFRPEFLNRFDEICLFTPLNKEDLLQVVDMMLMSVNATLAPQKISVRLDEAAKMVLVERGYDPQLGARPMRRIIQQTIENLVAKAILEGSATTGAALAITSEQILAELDKK